MIKWFAANSLVLNLDTTNIMKFIIKDSSQSTLHFGYKKMYIEETVNTKFLGLQIDNHINLKKHFEQIISQFSRVCYAIRSVVHTNNMNTLKSIYHAYFHSVTKYQIIFWG